MSRINFITGSSSASLRGAVAFSFLCTIPVLYGALLAPVASNYVFNTAVHRNLHEVVPERLYRAGVMNPERLKRVIREYKIKTVVDLRLSGPWDYQYGVSEREVVEETGAKYYHSKLRSSALPTQQRVDRLYRVIDEAETPVLFHCDDGVHRTGFATVLWLVEKEGYSFSDAMRQISLWYGYFEPEQLIRRAINGEPSLLSLLFEYEDDRKAQELGLRTWIETKAYPALRDDPTS